MTELTPNDDSWEIKQSEEDSVNDQSVDLLKTDGVDSIGFISSSAHPLFVNSTNVSESGIELISGKSNNLNEASEANVIVSDESNVFAIVDQFENNTSENVDDECYVVANFKQSTPVKHVSHTSKKSEHTVPFIEYVDLTQDEHEETKFEDSFVQGFTKDTRLCILLDVIPDADPDFLRRKVNEFKTDEDLQLFVLNALETQDYPKIAIKNILPKEAKKNVGEPKSGLNEDVSKLLSSKSLVSSTSQQSAQKDGSFVTSHFPDQDNFITFSTPVREKNLQDPPIVTTTISQTVTSSTAPHTTAALASSYANAFTLVNARNYQMLAQPKMTVKPTTQNAVGAKPHTVTSQEASSDHTQSTIIQAATSTHSEVRISVQDIGASQQGTKTLGTSLSMYIPTHSIVSSSQTDTNGNPFNLMVNVPTHPFTPMLQAATPHTLTPHTTWADATRPHVPNFLQDDAFPNAHVWMPLSINFFDAMRPMGPSREQRQYDKEQRRQRRYGLLDAATHYLDNNIMEDFLDSLNGSTKPKGTENQRLKLLADILIWADRKFLEKEADKLKNDDDIEKFLIRAIANEEMWNKCVTAENCAQRILPRISDSKYKILLELLPDASPAYLKRESAKLKNDEEVHEFAKRLSREQTYPKRRSLGITPKKKKNKRKQSEISEPETIDPKYQTLLDMLPDADPDFLLQESKMLENPDDLQKFVLKAVEDNTYPKRDQFLERQEYHKQWKKYIEDFNIKEFLKIIPNPVKFFYIEKVNSKNPLNLPGKFLQHRYRRKCTHPFGSFYNAAKNNLTKTCDVLDMHFQIKPRKYGVWNQKTIFPTSILQEIAFIQNKKEIAHYLLFKEEMKLEAYEKAKTEGALQECSCCYDHKLSEDMTSCLAGHLFCLSCIKRGSEVVIGNGGTKFPCYSEDCKEEFCFDVLKVVLNPDVFSRLLTRKQYEEVNAAGIPGLETCSFCEFCSIPPAEDKLFHCLNPSCMKVTCRSCKKLDHLPLSCEEFKQKETRQKMQSYVEDKMTEALVRTCWQCGTKFVKENGCNMMQCKCGAKMCYFCRQPIQDYNHFAKGRCGQHLDTTAHDEATVIKVGKEAKLEIEAANPGYSLQNDPTKLIGHEKHHKHKSHHHRHQV